MLEFSLNVIVNICWANIFPFILLCGQTRPQQDAVVDLCFLFYGLSCIKKFPITNAVSITSLVIIYSSFSNLNPVI